VRDDNNLVSELRQEGDLRFLYKLKINEAVLTKRNVNARPTPYVKQLIEQERKRKLQPSNIRHLRVKKTQLTKRQISFKQNLKKK